MSRFQVGRKAARASVRFRDAASWRLVMLGVLVGVLPVHKAGAVAGVGDAVILVGDMTDVWKWPREYMQWQRAASLAQTQIRELEALRDQLGRASTSVGKVDASPGKYAAALDALGEIRSLEKTLAQAASPKGMADLDGAPAPALNLRVLGESQVRSTTVLRTAELLLSLRRRQEEAARLFSQVLENEGALQKTLLGRLGKCGTVADLSAVQAALDASSQRLRQAQLKSAQLASECEAMEARHRLEQERRECAERDWGRALVERLRSRALTSLHAQSARSR